MKNPWRPLFFLLNTFEVRYDILHITFVILKLEGDIMNKIDCFGDICPVPILKMQKELSHLAPDDSFMMVVDHSCVIESIKEYLAKSKF